MVQELESPRLKQIIAEKFGLDLADAPSMLTVRLATRATDGQIHTGSVAKRVTVLLYLNPPGPGFEGQEGCLRLLRSPDDLEGYFDTACAGPLLVFPILRRRALPQAPCRQPPLDPVELHDQ